MRYLAREEQALNSVELHFVQFQEVTVHSSYFISTFSYRPGSSRERFTPIPCEQLGNVNTQIIIL